MSDIQKARDVLAKWRKDSSSAAAWQVFDSPGFEKHIAAGDRGYIGSIDDDTDADLIVGTAGNPALWDAIDVVLAWAQEAGPAPVLGRYEVKGMAAAIVAADERMSA